jgi:hypothetical protein
MIPRVMVLELREQAAAIDLSTLRTLSDMIDGAAGKRFIRRRIP